ncbi:MAG TPA: hypothetical protein DCY15_06060, partial [Ruminococcaceae bacterium]|nr:hypothetical protein [Oscillospiraceae bacterium]
IVPIMLSLITQKDCGLSKMAYNAVYDAMEYIAYNEDGSPKNDFRVENYGNRSVAECTEEEKETIYDHVPIKGYTDVVGEENLYYFAYNSFGDMYEIVDELEELIEKAKKDTGKDKVNLLPISLGGAVSVAYVGEHPQGEDINKIVLVVPAADGSEIVGKIMLGQLDYSDAGLYRNMFTKLVGEDNYTGWLINIGIRVLPKKVVIGLLDGVASGLADSALARVTTMWGLVPSSMYDELAEKYLVKGTKFAEDVERFHNAQINYKKNLKNYAANGVKIYDICGYGLELYSLIDSDSNSDKIIHSASTSLGATFSKVNEKLPKGYTQKAYKDTNFISPDGQVDASTCAFPYTTWFFGNQDHEKLARNDVVISLAMKLLIVKEMDVFTTVEYPQFNGHRNTRDLKKYIAEAEKVDLSTLSPEDSERLSKALADAKAILATTIVIEGKEEAAEAELYDALAEIGVYEKKNTAKDDALLFVCKTASELLYYFFGPRGFGEAKAA